MNENTTQNSSGPAGNNAWLDIIRRMDDICNKSEQSQAELDDKNSELESTQQLIKNVLSSMSEILIVCDIDGKIIQTNQALTVCLGIEAEQLMQRPLAQLFSKQDQEMAATFLQQTHTDELTDQKIHLLNADGEAILMSLNCSGQFDQQKHLMGIVITGRPLGELQRACDELQKTHEKLKTAQQQLIQSEKMASLGRLVAGVAHELNNPISFLYGNMHALQDYHDKFQTYIQAIHNGCDQTTREELQQQLRIDHIMADIAPLIEGSMEGAERVSAIAHNLCKFSAQQSHDYQSFDLINVIERATSWVMRSASIKLELNKNYPEELPLVNNEGYIHQVLINLLQNAVDAMQKTIKPQLSVQVKTNNQHHHITIADNGHGISENHLTNIFDPFFTTKDGTSGISGTGLGLSISHGLATEQCQGNLQAFKREQGGAAFTFSLPIQLNNHAVA